MKVRNLTGRQILVPGQRFVAPSPDFVTVTDNEDVQALVAAGALEVSPDTVAELESLNVDELQAEADRRGLEVDGTGSGGNVVKADLLAALIDEMPDPEPVDPVDTTTDSEENA